METTEMEKMAHIAIRDGDAEAIKSLLDAGLDPNLPFDQ